MRLRTQSSLSMLRSSDSRGLFGITHVLGGFSSGWYLSTQHSRWDLTFLFLLHTAPPEQRQSSHCTTTQLAWIILSSVMTSRAQKRCVCVDIRILYALECDVYFFSLFSLTPDFLYPLLFSHRRGTCKRMILFLNSLSLIKGKENNLPDALSHVLKRSSVKIKQLISLGRDHNIYMPRPGSSVTKNALYHMRFSLTRFSVPPSLLSSLRS